MFFSCFLICPWCWGKLLLTAALDREWHFHCLVSEGRKCSEMLPVKADWKLPYLNFPYWSVDGSDSMSINKQCPLKHTFTFLQYMCRLNPFATHVNVYLQTFVLFLQIYWLVFNSTSAESTLVYCYLPMQLDCGFTFCKSQKFPRWRQHLESCYLGVFSNPKSLSDFPK